MNKKITRTTGYFKVISTICAIAVVAGFVSQPSQANAASVTSFSDNLSRLKTATLSDHEIKFVSPTGVTSGQTITLTFGAGFTLGVFAVVNADFATGSTGSCTGATYTEQALAAAPSGSTWGIATTSASTLTLTSGTGTATAGNCVRFRLGTNAVTGGTGVSFITNGSAGATTATVTVGGTFTDTGTAFVPIITNDQVSVSATVDPSITFSISANTIGFGSLSASVARFATNDSVGSTTAVTAHNLIAGTNASSGYSIYLSGSTLASGGNTITAIGGTAASSTPGSAQFGVTVISSAGGTGTPSSPYNFSNSYAFNASTSTQVTIASVAAPSANTTYNLAYVANIPAQQAAGAYTTTLTYTATGTY